MKESKSLNFVSKDKFLKSDGMKSIHKNMMKSNGGILSYHGSENEGMRFVWWFFQ